MTAAMLSASLRAFCKGLAARCTCIGWRLSIAGDDDSRVPGGTDLEVLGARKDDGASRAGLLRQNSFGEGEALSAARFL